MKLAFLLFAVFAVFAIAYANGVCQMPNGELGECISLFHCPGLLRASANPFPGTENYLRTFKCGDGLVCCGPPWDETSDKRVVSDRKYCGYQHSDDFPSSSASEASLYEFPWLAAIMAVEVETNRYDVLNQGALVSNRYVISLAQLSELRPEKLKITGVRLGEFNIKNKTDCVNNERLDLEECSTTEDYGIEKIIYHPFYERRYKNLNNIALIKLNRNVSYSDYIRPICLPILETAYPKPGDILYITGWGFTESKHVEENLSNVRKRISSRFIDSDECRRLIPQDVRMSITSYVTCTLDLPNNTDFTCDGDAGAPVMFSYKNQWYLEGIATAIINYSCGTKYPVISLRLSKYLDWIKQNML